MCNQVVSFGRFPIQVAIIKIFKGPVDYLSILMLLNLGAVFMVKFEDNVKAGCEVMIVIVSKYLISLLKTLVKHFKGFIDGFRLCIYLFN